MHPYLLRFANPVTGAPAGLTTYALCMFLGAGLAIGLAILLARHRGLPRYDVFAGGLIAFAGGLVGAKLFYLLLNGPEIVRQLGFRALLGSGGFVWYGGFVGGVLGLVLYARGYKLSLLAFVDVAAPAAALGQAFGRVGCFTAGCCYGKVAPPGYPLAVRFPPGAIAPPGIPLYPVQLFEAAGLLVLAALLAVLVVRARRLPLGGVAWSYMVLYAILRIWTESLRMDDRGPFIGPLSPSQAIAAVVLVLAVVLLALHLRRRRGATPAV